MVVWLCPGAAFVRKQEKSVHGEIAGGGQEKETGASVCG